MAQAPALPGGFELPLEPRLPRIGSVDEVGVEERAAALAKRSIKKDAKLFALELAIRMMDLTTLEGGDTPGKVAALCSKAVRPDPSDPAHPVRRRGLRLPEPRPDRGRAAARHGRQGRVRRDRVPVRPVAARRQAPRRRGRRRDGRRRGRHGHRPRRVPLRPLREGLRRDRPREGGLRRRAPEGDPRGRRARHLRQRPPRVDPGHGRGSRLHQDVDRQALRRGDAAGHAGHARGDPRRPRADRAARWA